MHRCIWNLARDSSFVCSAQDTNCYVAFGLGSIYCRRVCIFVWYKTHFLICEWTGCQVLLFIDKHSDWRIMRIKNRLMPEFDAGAYRLVTWTFEGLLRFFDWLSSVINAIRLVFVIAFFWTPMGTRIGTRMGMGLRAGWVLGWVRGWGWGWGRDGYEDGYEDG